MSIQDESFPDDEFLDELDFSANAGKRFTFPHHHRQQQQCEHNATSTNTSSSSTDQNVSTESTNGRPSSGLSSKTTASDPTGLADSESKKSELIENRHKKAISYQDIHSEYTKRRYKHVESKVGQYIANMKAEDQKRRNSTKFQRHRSMPETLSGAGANSVVTSAATRHFSAADLNKSNNESTSDAEEDSSENMTGTTASSRGQHESSDDAGATVDFIDKLTYAHLVNEKERIQSYSDYLQIKLDEKVGENMRLKRNVDFMRIELANCKDKMKKAVGQVGSCGMLGSNGIYGVAAGRHSFQALLYCQTKCAKATQTELIMPSPTLLPHDIYVTPDTPDANNNKMFESGGISGNGKSSKSVATIQPLSLNFSNIVEQDSSENGVLRQRTNSNPSTKLLSPPASIPNRQSSRNSCPSNSDSAIDIESAELVSPKSTQRPMCHEEFIYYDKRSGRYAALQTLNASSDTYDDNRAVDRTDSHAESSNKTSKKQHSLRRRWLRIFGRCTRCSDHNQTLDGSATLQDTYTQIPLLEKSFENHCRNLR